VRIISCGHIPLKVYTLSDPATTYSNTGKTVYIMVPPTQTPIILFGKDFGPSLQSLGTRLFSGESSTRLFLSEVL
jgi:hypothetical protein